MIKFRAKTLDGLCRLMRMGEMDAFDVLEAAPSVIRDERERAQAEERERRRLEWLAAYEPDLALCAADE